MRITHNSIDTLDLTSIISCFTPVRIVAMDIQADSLLTKVFITPKNGKYSQN